ncbi:MAG: CotH kinase family protein [Vicinamibacterales bacterium]
MKRIAALAATLAVCVISASTRVAGSTTAELFDSSKLQRIDLWLHTADWEKLRQNFQTNEYYPADLTWNGETIRNAGIRSRGAASRNGTKPGLKVDFDRYDSDQRFLGLKSLVLDNLAQDASGIHETVTNWMFARMGIPAAREVHARLNVNGNYAGLYAVIEPVDKVFLARVFGSIGDDVQNDGYLYEFNKVAVWDFSYLGSDLAPYKAYFEAKTHETKTDEDLYRPIERLLRLANETPAADFPAVLGPYLDINGLVRYLAVQNVVAENDGFLGEFGVNNFYLYRLEHSEQHVLIPWDDDLAFNGPTYDVLNGVQRNALASRLMENRDYFALYVQALQEVVNSADVRPIGEAIGPLEEEIRRQIGLIDEAMLEDPLKPWTATDYTTGRDLMIQFAPQRLRYVGCEVARLTGAPPC